VVGAVFGLCTQETDAPIGRIATSVADQLGIEQVTILAVRPDRYIGLRHDGRDPHAVQAYLDGLSG
jgi:hypothetical protein